MRTVKYWQAINQALHEEMARDERVVIIGEDVAAPGGPFAATKGLLAVFGADRVRDTPISEATIVGTALGASMAGYRVVVEVMFLDFVALAMDQVVNQAAKVSYMSAGSFNAPVVIRSVCASERRTGPQHSQNLEAWLAHVPGLKVVWGSTPSDARGLLKAAIRDDGPVYVIESLARWSTRGEVPSGADEGLVTIGQAVVRRTGQDLTLVTWGGAAARCGAAVETVSRTVDVELIDLRTIQPWDRRTVLSSVRKTGRLLIVHDAVTDFGVGAEIAASVGEACFDGLREPIRRLGAPFAPPPFAPRLEDAFLPHSNSIATEINKLMRSGR